MGFSLPTLQIKKWGAVSWAEAKKTHHYGECNSFWHKFFSGEKRISCKIQPDGSSASLFICEKCGGVKETFIFVKIF